MKRFMVCSLVVFCTLGVANAQKHHIVKQSQARMITTNMGAITAPVVAELGDISAQKITHTLSFDVSFYPDAKSIISDLPEYKQAVIADYCITYDYDLIVNAIFQVSTDNSNHMSVTVMGYPAKYKRFRPATQADTWMLNYIGVETTNSKQIINAK